MLRIHSQALRNLTVIAALIPFGVHAAPYFPILTGEKFVRDMLAEPDGGAASVRRERAMGYMDGVMDGTADLLWCPAGQKVAHELSYVAAEEMKKLPADQLRKSAAPLAVAVLAKLYPCPASAKGRTS